MVKMVIRNKIIENKDTLVEELSKIDDGSVIAIAGFNNSVTPLYIMYSLIDSYKKYGRPKNIFIEADSFPGVPGTGLDIIMKEIYENRWKDFISGILIPYLYRSEYLQRLAMENYFEIYSFSIGITTSLFRELGSGRPGVLTKIGLGTFHDPRLDNSAVNEKARIKKRCKAELININNEEYLLYTAPKPQIAFVRATSSDIDGNLSMEEEGIYGATLPVVLATKSNPGGKVFAQVKYIVSQKSRSPKEIHVPGPLVDYIVHAPKEYAPQGSTVYYDPMISGQSIPNEIKIKFQNREMDERFVIRRRVAYEIAKLIAREKRDIIVNFGTGLPTEISSVLAEEGISECIHTTVESGPWGGVALTGNDFGLSYGPYSIIQQADQFIVYEGGIADLTSLGFLEVDKNGNVNPSYTGERIPGPGGFSDISSGINRIYFAGGFTGGERDIRVHENKLIIKKDGDIIKFVERVKKVFFSGEYAIKRKKEVLYITERAVFTLTESGLKLIEIAPGVDIDKDILEKMEFKPIIDEYDFIPEIIFSNKKMNLKEISNCLI
ncbi:MAG: CoA-transferase [Thermoplasmata archaeon]